MSVLNEITMRKLANDQFFSEVFPKNQIYLHHTAGADNAQGVISWWGKTQTRVATAIVIERSGKIYQAFSSKYWAYHLGLKGDTFSSRGLRYIPLDRQSIGIELTAWGGLTKKGQKFFNYVGGVVSKEEVVDLGFKFRGFRYYHKYTKEQVESVRKLLEYWGAEYGIPLTFDEDVFDVTERALKGEAGVFTHCSVRTDKNDIYPDPNLIEMWRRFP